MTLKLSALEDTVPWRKIHNPWISEVYQALKPQVAGRLGLSIDQEITLIEMDSAPQGIRADIHLTELGGRVESGTPRARMPAGAVAYAEGLEQWSAESRHYVVLRGLAGGQVVALLEILSPTNKGCFARADFESFLERRVRLLAGTISYLEIDAVPAGTRWLPKTLKGLESHRGVAWSAVPDPCGRRFRGWAWDERIALPTIPWDIGAHGVLMVDLRVTLQEALLASGFDMTG
jgi:hypothetical protein